MNKCLYFLPHLSMKNLKLYFIYWDESSNFLLSKECWYIDIYWWYISVHKSDLSPRSGFEYHIFIITTINCYFYIVLFCMSCSGVRHLYSGCIYRLVSACCMILFWKTSLQSKLSHITMHACVDILLSHCTQLSKSETDRTPVIPIIVSQCPLL